MQHELQNVTIVGPASGNPNTSYTFIASASPPTATLPISYTWSPAPGSGQGTTQVTYTWSSSGQKTIQVSVSNPVNTVSNTHTIRIGAPAQLLKTYLPALRR